MGLKHWSSSTGFCAVASSGHSTKALCPAPTTHGIAGQYPRQRWMSPAQPSPTARIREQQRVQLKMAQTNFSASLAMNLSTSGYEARKPRSAMGPF